MFNDPLTVITGVVGDEEAFTVTLLEVPEQLPLPVVTLNVPVLVTVMACDVAPFDHK